MYKKNSFCSYCGNFLGDWDKSIQCNLCQNISYLNPIPVTIMIVPVDEGLLLIQRNIEPQKGHLALPGGFIDSGETWQEAGAREVLEETGVKISPDSITDFAVFNSNGFIVIFGACSGVKQSDLPKWKPNAECSARLLVFEPIELAFPQHTQVMEQFFGLKDL